MPLAGLFGGKAKAPPPPPTSNPTTESQAAEFARSLTGYAPGEEALVERMGGQFGEADARYLQELDNLRTRGEGLLSLDPTRFANLYDPAINRLKTTYEDADRGVTEEMNARGIAGVGNFAPDVAGGEAFSSPEMYAKGQVAREFAQEAGNVMKDAQANAINQNIAAYNARMAEPQAAANRYSAVATPYVNAKVTPESERMGQRASLTSNTIGQRLGHQANMHQINTGRKIAGQEQLMNAIGGGLGALGQIGGMMALRSDPNMKEDISPAAGPQEEEQALDDIRGMGLHRFQYKEGDGSEKFGPMADSVPEDMGNGEQIDVGSWLGKLTAAVKSLDEKFSNAYGNGLRATAVRGGGV